MPNVAIGLSLAGCLALGGICVIRRPRHGLIALALISIVPGIVAVAVATPPMPYFPPPPVQPRPGIPGYTISGAMIVEVVDEGDEVHMILHKDTPLLYVGPKRFQ